MHTRIVAVGFPSLTHTVCPRFEWHINHGLRQNVVDFIVSKVPPSTKQHLGLCEMYRCVFRVWINWEHSKVKTGAPKLESLKQLCVTNKLSLFLLLWVPSVVANLSVMNYNVIAMAIYPGNFNFPASWTSVEQLSQLSFLKTLLISMSKRHIFMFCHGLVVFASC